MPCTLSNPCNNDGANQEAGLPQVSSNQYANMGWTGFVALNSGRLKATNVILRVTSADVNLKQEITKPDVIDGRIDKTVYQLGPKLVDGTLSLPVIADTTSIAGGNFSSCPNSNNLQTSAGALLNAIWCWATARGSQGRMIYDDVELDIRYANHAAFAFDNCIVNTLGMTVAQSDMVTMDINVIGKSRKKFDDAHLNGGQPRLGDFLSPARVLTWNDVSVNAFGEADGCTPNFGNGTKLFSSPQVRNFDFEVNNNAERYFTLNGFLFPVDINVRKREITGSLTLMGLADALRIFAENNQDRFTSKAVLRLAMYVGAEPLSGGSRDWEGAGAPSGNSMFFKEFTGTIFEIEELSLTDDVMETKVNWHALAADDTNYEAVHPCSSPQFPAWQ